MYFEDASKQQLLTVALYENCDLDYKYKAAKELQIRRWHNDMLPQLLTLWGKGYSAFQIGIEMEIPESTVRSQLRKYNLFGRRVNHDH